MLWKNFLEIRGGVGGAIQKGVSKRETAGVNRGYGAAGGGITSHCALYNLVVLHNGGSLTLPEPSRNLVPIASYERNQIPGLAPEIKI